MRSVLKRQPLFSRHANIFTSPVALLTAIFLLLVSLLGIPGQAAAASSSLALRAVSGAKGTTLTVPVTLTTAGNSVYGVTIELGYDAAVLGSPTAAFSQAIIDSGALTITNDLAPGLFRMIFVIVPDQAAAVDGVMANVTFAISPTATLGVSPISFNTVEAVDSFAILVPITGTNGSVNVITKTGDSDADGSVSIAEVQSAINMFLGLKPVAGYVDMDGNSTASIAEVQKTINSFLGL